jgi:hypothetical protein
MMTCFARPTHHERHYCTCLLVTFVLATGGGLRQVSWRMEEAKRQKDAVEAILKARGDVFYDFQIDAAGKVISGAQPPCPHWARKLLGEDFFCDVVLAVVRHESSLEDLAGLTKLQCVSVWEVNLRANDVRRIRGLTALHTLVLGGKGITDQSLERLKEVRALRRLVLANAEVTDAGLRHLDTMTELRSLCLANVKVTDHGVERLQHALPQCTIDQWDDTQERSDVGEK